MVISKRKAFILFLGLFLPVVLSGHLYVQPSDTYRSFFTGGEFFVSCIVDSEEGSPVTRLVWQTPSGEITDTEGRVHVESEERSLDEKVLHLFVKSVRLEDEGDYTCSAVQKGEEISLTVKVVVYRSISFTGTPEEHLASEGDDFSTILCNVIADPEPRVVWSYNGSSIYNGGRYKVSKDGLTIANISRYDAGKYTCTAVVITQKNSLIKRYAVTFRVQYAPFFTETESELNSDLDADLQSSRSVYAAIDSTASLICKARGYPDPTYQWIRDGVNVEELASEGQDAFNVSHFRDRSVLNVTLHKEDLLGDYVCRVSNPLGSNEKHLTIKKGDPPSRPSVSLNHTDETSASFALFLGKHASGRNQNHRRNPLRVTGYRVQFRNSIGAVNGLDPIDWESADFLEFKEDENLVVRNLSSGTGYVVRVAAKNAAGYGQYSPEIKFNMFSKKDNHHVVQDQEAAIEPGVGNPNGASTLALFHVILILVAPAIALSQSLVPLNEYTFWLGLPKNLGKYPSR